MTPFIEVVTQYNRVNVKLALACTVGQRARRRRVPVIVRCLLLDYIDLNLDLIPSLVLIL